MPWHAKCFLPGAVRFSKSCVLKLSNNTYFAFVREIKLSRFSVTDGNQEIFFSLFKSFAKPFAPV